MVELDRYYTPDAEAVQIVESLSSVAVRSCVDTACGSGNLLKACERVHPRVRCIGMDRDRRAIAKLIGERPKWLLGVGDLLRPATWDRVIVGVRRSPEYVLINPPFSMGDSKGKTVEFGGRSLRVSIAMAHLLMTLERFDPVYGGRAIVPESLLYSDLDAAARVAIQKKFSLRLVSELRNTTFHGARANALVVALERQTLVRNLETKPGQEPLDPCGVKVIRGGLPVFEAVTSRAGLPFVHSTDLVAMSCGSFPARKVRVIGRGVVSGHMVLVPRVGVPTLASIAPLKLARRVQLSDCVIALKASSGIATRELARRIRREWSSFVKIYRGTGARYTTVAKLEAWLGGG